ncbi:MAG: hypothetical protein R2932_20400 [Caldilineaceae bacterium]
MDMLKNVHGEPLHHFALDGFVTSMAVGPYLPPWIGLRSGLVSRMPVGSPAMRRYTTSMLRNGCRSPVPLRLTPTNGRRQLTLIPQVTSDGTPDHAARYAVMPP